MIHDKLKLIIAFDKEAEIWNASVSVIGVEVFLANFKTQLAADRFINDFVNRLKSEALYWSDYEIIHN